MSYVESIGGDPINPNPFSYSQLSIGANIALSWDISDQYYATSWIDITSSSTYTVTCPPANDAGTGSEIVFNNYGAQTITINDFGNNSITTVTAGQTKRVWITNNATAVGTWRSANIGAGSSTADASALAGYGLQAFSGVLNLRYVPTAFNTNQTLGVTHRAALVTWVGGAGIFNLTAPATLTSGWFCAIKNAGTGILTLTPASGMIDGAISIAMASGEGFIIATDGSDFYTIGRVSSIDTGLTLLSKSVAGSSNVTLTAAEENYNILNFTGALTGNININVSTTVRSWIIYNATTGAFSLTMKTTSGAGVAVPRGSRVTLYSDGTNVVSVDFPPYFDTTVLLKNASDSTKQATFDLSAVTTATTRNYALPDANTTLVGTAVAQTIANKTIQTSSLRDSDVTFVDNADATKQLAFQCSGITTATTRTVAIPDANFTMVGVDVQQTLLNKKVSDSTFQIVDNADNTKEAEFQVSGITTATKRTFALPNFDGTLATLAGAESLTNKTIQSSAIQSTTMRDSDVTFIDNADATKIMKFENNNITTGNTRTMSVPDISGVLSLIATNSIGANGYLPLYTNAAGATVILQWGIDNNVSASKSINFTTAFSSAVYCVLVTPIDQNPTFYVNGTPTTSAFSVVFSVASKNYWFAIGV